MGSATLLIIANAVVWIGVGLYLFSLSARQNALERRLRRMEKTNHDRRN